MTREGRGAVFVFKMYLCRFGLASPLCNLLLSRKIVSRRVSQAVNDYICVMMIWVDCCDLTMPGPLTRSLSTDGCAIDCALVIVPVAESAMRFLDRFFVESVICMA